MHRIVAFTGAGISKASGIPTFAEMGDLRERLTRENFEADPGDVLGALLQLKKTADAVAPNPAHRALADHKVPVITMNIDGLHTRAGSREVIEVHGNLEFVYCPKCASTFDFYRVEESMYCKECNTVLQPNVVLYGDMIPHYFTAIDLIGSAQELLVVGTSFYTSTASDFTSRAKFAGIKVTVINEDAETRVPAYLAEVLGPAGS